MKNKVEMHPEVTLAWQEQAKLDSLNLIRIQKIIEQGGGYPGKSLVGSSAGNVAFFVIQHAPDSIQAKYHDMIVDAGLRNELKRSHVAMYQDRNLMNMEEPQIFGTQIRIIPRKDPSTGELVDSTFLWPIRDTTNIDSLRLWNGLDPLEGYLKHWGLSRWGN